MALIFKSPKSPFFFTKGRGYVVTLHRKLTVLSSRKHGMAKRETHLPGVKQCSIMCKSLKITIHLMTYYQKTMQTSLKNDPPCLISPKIMGIYGNPCLTLSLFAFWDTFFLVHQPLGG